MTTRWSTRISTPLGPLTIGGDDGGITVVTFAADAAPEGPIVTADPHRAGPAFTAFFAGDLAALDALPLTPAGTPFQQSVWAELRRVPPGATLTYSDLAARLDRPKAMRAVGRANATNPVAIAIPCHRVVTRDGRLGGYAGGLDRKRWLLAHEGAPGYLVP